MDDLSDEQVGAFLGSLYPAGEHAYLHNATQVWLSALVGNVPMSLPGEYSRDDECAKARKLAVVLRNLANGLDRAAGLAAQRSTS